MLCGESLMLKRTEWIKSFGIFEDFKDKCAKALAMGEMRGTY